jgi:hypothetical protein
MPFGNERRMIREAADPLYKRVMANSQRLRSLEERALGTSSILDAAGIDLIRSVVLILEEGTGSSPRCQSIIQPLKKLTHSLEQVRDFEHANQNTALLEARCRRSIYGFLDKHAPSLKALSTKESMNNLRKLQGDLLGRQEQREAQDGMREIAGAAQRLPRASW